MRRHLPHYHLPFISQRITDLLESKRAMNALETWLKTHKKAETEKDSVR